MLTVCWPGALTKPVDLLRAHLKIHKKYTKVEKSRTNAVLPVCWRAPPRSSSNFTKPVVGAFSGLSPNIVWWNSASKRFCLFCLLRVNMNFVWFPVYTCFRTRNQFFSLLLKSVILQIDQLDPPRRSWSGENLSKMSHIYICICICNPPSYPPAKIRKLHSLQANLVLAKILGLYL